MKILFSIFIFTNLSIPTILVHRFRNNYTTHLSANLIAQV